MGKRTCKTALGPPAWRLGDARAARDAALYGRNCNSSAPELHQNPAKPVSERCEMAPIRVLKALQRPPNEQVWGHFRHNWPLIHRNGAWRRLVPVGSTPARGFGTQACAPPKFLARHGKTELSTEGAGPYYYHYPLIKNIKKKTGQQEARERKMGGRRAPRSRRKVVPPERWARAETCKKGLYSLSNEFYGVGVWGGGAPISESLSGPDAGAAGGPARPSTAVG